MIYLTGDTHREFGRVGAFCDKVESTKDDILVVLGDAAINYYGRDRDIPFKQMLSAELPITLLCIHGNHKMRPESRGTYEEVEWHGGIVYREPEFPDILFAKDGEIYDLDGKKCVALGGAYSVDKYYRLSRNYGWWADELPSEEIKGRVQTKLDAANWKVDVVLSHTCPKNISPPKCFSPVLTKARLTTVRKNGWMFIEGRLAIQKYGTVFSIAMDEGDQLI